MNILANTLIKNKDDIKKLGLNTFFFSDASSAIKTEIFKKLNGYDGKDFPTNEDMYIAYKLITNGYKIRYCADSEVVHSHKFTLKQQYKRYYDTGKFFKQNEYLNEYKVNKVLITSLKDNIASRKVIEANGGIFEKEFYDEITNNYIQRFWITF